MVLGQLLSNIGSVGRKFGQFVSETVAPKLGQFYSSALANPLIGSLLRRAQVPQAVEAGRQAVEAGKQAVSGIRRLFQRSPTMPRDEVVLYNPPLD